MRTELIEEASSLLKKPNPERIKAFITKIDMSIEAYDEILKDHSRSMKMFETRMRELCLIREMFEIKKSVEKADGNTV